MRDRARSFPPEGAVQDDAEVESGPECAVASGTRATIAFI